MSVCFLSGTERENINSRAKADIQWHVRTLFFLFVIHSVDITRQIQSVNIYAVQYINHTWKGKESHPVCLFFLGFCSFKSKALPGV